MNCIQCGAGLAAQARFCGACGTPVAMDPLTGATRQGPIGASPLADPLAGPTLSGASAAPSTTAVKLGDFLDGKYLIIGELGKGGAGNVYRAVEMTTSRHYAVKVLHANLSSDPAFLRQVAHEVALAQELIHPNALRVFSLQDHGPRKYVVSEFLEGTDLRTHVARQGGRLPADEAKSVIEALSGAVDQLHSKGLVHLDIKPTNVFMTRDGVKLLDFGLAQAVQAGRGAAGGTPAWMSPEQVMGQEVDRRSDVYSLGLMWWWMVAGELPFDAADEGATRVWHVAGPRDGSKLGPAAGAILRAVQSDRKARPASVKELLSAPTAPVVVQPPRPTLKAGDLIAGEVKGVKFEMSYIPPGTFLMGSPDSDSEADTDEKPQHEVRLTKAFALLRTPVTQELWKAVMGSEPFHFKGSKRPVERISWFDAVKFCNVLSKLSNLPEAYIVNGTELNLKADSTGYRLPTEAEWEYACRAGTTTPRYGPTDEVAWYVGTTGARWQDDIYLGGGETRDVTTKKPNEWGLHDMLGNVWEWTQDCYGGYSAESQPDPQYSVSGSSRVLRGGSWSDHASNVRAGYRNAGSPGSRGGNLGFRPARSLP